MRMGIKAILLIVAIVFFLLTLVGAGDDHTWLALGLIFLAGALLLDDIGVSLTPRRRLR